MADRLFFYFPALPSSRDLRVTHECHERHTRLHAYTRVTRNADCGNADFVYHLVMYCMHKPYFPFSSQTFDPAEIQSGAKTKIFVKGIEII